MRPYNLVCTYQRVNGTCCLHFRVLTLDTTVSPNSCVTFLPKLHGVTFRWSFKFLLLRFSKNGKVSASTITTVYYWDASMARTARAVSPASVCARCHTLLVCSSWLLQRRWILGMAKVFIYNGLNCHLTGRLTLGIHYLFPFDLLNEGHYRPNISTSNCSILMLIFVPLHLHPVCTKF